MKSNVKRRYRPCPDMHFGMRGDMEGRWQCGGGNSKGRALGSHRRCRMSMDLKGVHAFVSCRGRGPLVAMNIAEFHLRDEVLDEGLLRE
jgi:hypothetical protein